MDTSLQGFNWNICKLIACTPTSGQDNNLLKTKLLETYREHPDPIEIDLDKFQMVIREHKRGGAWKC